MVVKEIGYFGDARLARNGALLLERMHERQSVCIRTLADNRAEQARFGRFLSNEEVTVEEMISSRALLTAAAAVGRHVLALHDTSEINYQAQRRRGLEAEGREIDLLLLDPRIGVDLGQAPARDRARLRLRRGERRPAGGEAEIVGDGAIDQRVERGRAERLPPAGLRAGAGIGHGFGRCGGALLGRRAIAGRGRRGGPLEIRADGAAGEQGRGEESRGERSKADGHRQSM